MEPINASRILNYLDSSIICLSEALTINQLNETAEVFFEHSKKNLTNRPFASLFHPNGENSILSSLEFCKKHNHQITEHEAPITLFNGKNLTVDYSIHPIMEVGKLNLLVELRPMDRHLEIARDDQRIIQQQASQQLARGMAHEIKNPLGGIRGAAQLLEGEISNPALKEYTDVIIREADRLQRLLNDMLGPNRKIEKKPMNILEVLEHVRSLVLAEYQNIHIIRDYDPSIPELGADKNQLIQAVLNIVRNAAQSIGDAGEIRIKTRVSRQHTIGHKRYKHVLQLDISDNGPGIAADILENMFLPMVTNKPQGSGLGLPIAQQIIFQHNGIIQCQSNDQQTTFTILLPMSNDA
jgi:two-component system nitrogen regulation sensor histidine kinase GlnL